MAVFLTVLLSGLSLGMLAGRIYEVLNLTDAATGFFYYRGIVFTPYILGLFVIITLCCGVIIFGDKKDETPFFSHSSRIIAVASGAMFIVYSVMSYGTNIGFWFTLAGGVALVLLGIFELHNKGGIIDILISVLLVVFVIGRSLDAIIFDVYTVHNIKFTQNALTTVCSGMFFLAVFKNIFAPQAKSRMLLYITGMLAAIMCGIMNIADIVCMAVNDAIILPDLFIHAGFAFLGFFAFDNAISSIPSKKTAYAVEQEDSEDAGTMVKVYKGDPKTDKTISEPIYKESQTVQQAAEATINCTAEQEDAPVVSREFDLSKNKEFTQFFARIEEKDAPSKKTEKSATKQTFKADKNSGGKV